MTTLDVAVPLFTNGLKTLDHILTKAEEFAKTKNINVDTEFAPARLIADQLPLTFQVQNATKAVKVNLNRLTGITYEPFVDNEKTFQDLHRRIEVTLELLASIRKEEYVGKDDEIVEL